MQYFEWKNEFTQINRNLENKTFKSLINRLALNKKEFINENRNKMINLFDHIPAREFLYQYYKETTSKISGNVLLIIIEKLIRDSFEDYFITNLIEIGLDFWSVHFGYGMEYIPFLYILETCKTYPLETGLFRIILNTIPNRDFSTFFHKNCMEIDSSIYKLTKKLENILKTNNTKDCEIFFKKSVRRICDLVKLFSDFGVSPLVFFQNFDHFLSCEIGDRYIYNLLIINTYIILRKEELKCSYLKYNLNIMKNEWIIRLVKSHSVHTHRANSIDVYPKFIETLFLMIIYNKDPLTKHIKTIINERKLYHFISLNQEVARNLDCIEWKSAFSKTIRKGLKELECYIMGLIFY